MTPTLLHAISRKADAITPDAELLARYLRERDPGAFEELLRRHGPLVWSVCRQALAQRADAEDAFQAVFLALVRSADRIRDGRTLPAWLHGVAVRVAMRAKRDFARRRTRERAAASPETDRPVSDEAWEALVAAVHEEVQRLPEAERTAFVLCELQGVSQADAAARLGWPLGSLSGRLCKARRRLLDRLAARGIAPAAAVGVGITTRAACAVPEGVFEVVKTFPGAPGAASTAAAALARGLVEGVAMRVKLTAAVVVVAFGLTGGAVWLSKAEAQPEAGKPPGAEGAAGGAKPKKPGQPPPGASGYPGAPGRPPRTDSADDPPPGFGRLAAATWEYKFVDVAAERKEFEKVITQHGKDGWEFCGSERFLAENKAEFVLVFKRSKGGTGFGGLGGEMMMPGMPGMARPGGLGGAGGGPKRAPADKPEGGGESPRELIQRTFKLKHASPLEVGTGLRKALPNARGLTFGGPLDDSSQLRVNADPETMKAVEKLVEELDAKVAKSGGKPTPGPMGGPSGASPMGNPSGMSGLATGPPIKPPGVIQFFDLKHAKADELATVLKKLYPSVDMTGDPRTNALIVRADRETLMQITELLQRLDVDAGKRK